MRIWFVRYDTPWFMRGASHNRGMGSGMFMFDEVSGQEYWAGSFRVISTMLK